jgi:leader peptidase (prepilin peptidase) / N-methyltransferase
MIDVFLTLSLSELVFIVTGFGVIIGSFLNVYIYRFHTGKSLAGSSHCLSCQAQLSWYDLFPLVSYLALGGRCRRCSARIPSRYFWVELTTAILFVAVILTVPVSILTPVWLFLMAVLVVITVYDLCHLIIPHAFVYTLIGIALTATVLESYLVGGIDWYSLGLDTLAGILAFSFFGSLWWYSSGRWVGLGDAKLALPLGYLVGIGGVFSMLVLSFWIGAILSLLLIAGQRLIARRGQQRLRFVAGPLTMKSEVPFAPFLILGFLAVFLFGVDVIGLFTYAFI